LQAEKKQSPVDCVRVVVINRSSLARRQEGLVLVKIVETDISGLGAKYFEHLAREPGFAGTAPAYDGNEMGFHIIGG
jgi:hypothetical protein